jgi:hypothetical protein
MQFALMIYHTPEEFDMRKNDFTYLVQELAPGSISERYFVG